ncbi:MAG: hypothetical protein B7X10_00715 [Burkholderiales bacterium 21-58-4]|nr:MAG: hypothetical protein B7X10_00715 [Burkholderiales bacterium 21-58-4]
MALDQHTVSVPTGAQPANTDRTTIGNLADLANLSGAAGVTVTTAVAMADLPAHYSVHVNPGQGCAVFVDGKTNAGFNVHLVPLTSALSIAAGTFDVTVVA